MVRFLDDLDGDTILDDGLSDIDDDDDDLNNTDPQSRSRTPITSSQAAARRLAQQQYKQCQFVLLISTWVMSLVVATIQYYSRNYYGGHSDTGWGFWGENSAAREKENQVRLKQTLEFLVTREVVSVESLLLPNNYPLLRNNRTVNMYDIDVGINDLSDDSPQLRAARWIATQDIRRLTIPKSTTPSFYGGEIIRDSKHEYPFLQRYALATLFFSTGGDEHWKFTTNFLDGWHECAWFDIFDVLGSSSQSRFIFGVVCDGYPNLEEKVKESDVGGRGWVVTHISLPPLNNMIGTLCPELKVLKYLKELHIQLNPDVTGPIPPEYGSLKNLRVLNLAYNSLSGSISETISQLTQLEELQLEYNFFKGDINFVTSLPNLVSLSLEYNANITGTIPAAISNVNNLQVLSLSNMAMYGTLPPGMMAMSNLRLLLLDDNNFSGSVEVLQNLPNLTHLYLEDNHFNDVIDRDFLSGLDKLIHLDISGNDFRGSIAEHLLNFPELEVLDMSSNHEMKGPFPEGVFMFTHESKLEHLSLHSINITGQIPPAIHMLQALNHLDMSSNQLSGDIPSALGQLSNLKYLFLARNNFSKGSIPKWLRNMTELQELSLKTCSLTGVIPDWIGDDLTDLLFLDLGENFLEGTLPVSIAKMTDLWVLILNQNKLNGTIPSSFAQLKSLETFLIDNNQFEGNTSTLCERKDKIKYFIADCGGDQSLFGSDATEIQCDCCTLCCRDENTTCNDAEWLANQESIWENGYSRVKWEFEAGDVSPSNS